MSTANRSSMPSRSSFLHLASLDALDVLIMLTFNEDKKLGKLLNLIFHTEASHGNDTYMYSTQNQNTIDKYVCNLYIKSKTFVFRVDDHRTVAEERRLGLCQAGSGLSCG